MAIAIGRLIRRYCLVTLVPAFVRSKMAFSFIKQGALASLPFIGCLIGYYLDRQETERYSLFRDKTALYGRVLKEGEKPTWP